MFRPGGLQVGAFFFSCLTMTRQIEALGEGARTVIDGFAVGHLLHFASQLQVSAYNSSFHPRTSSTFIPRFDPPAS